MFFTIIGSTFAASTLGSLASLKRDLANMRKFHAWKNREVSTRLIADMEDDGGDNDEIDEYGFLVGSLITLDKISKDDVKEIMDRFRELAGGSLRITKYDIERHNFTIFQKHQSSARIKRESSTFWELGLGDQLKQQLSKFKSHVVSTQPSSNET